MRRDIDFLVDIKVLVEDVLGQDDVLVGLVIIRIFHLLLLDLALHLLSLLHLLTELHLLGQELLLQAGLDSFFHWAGLSLAVGALLEVRIELLLSLIKSFLSFYERVVLVQVLEQRVLIQ